MSNHTEIRWHGRGGQGAKTAALLLADVAFQTGKYVQGFPEYGPERMGAPITAYYFINSSGQTSSSYIGKDPAADSWRALTNNLFYTKDEAVKYRDSILKKKI